MLTLGLIYFYLNSFYVRRFEHKILDFQPSEASDTKIQLPGLEETIDEPPVKRLKTKERIKVDVDK